MKDKSFFDEIQKKTKVEISKDFDDKFWDRFERENPKPSKGFSLFSPMGLVTACLTVVVGIGAYTQAIKYMEPSNVQIAEILIMEDTLENLELLAEVDVEMMEYADEDWDVLLAEDV